LRYQHADFDEALAGWWWDEAAGAGAVPFERGGIKAWAE